MALCVNDARNAGKLYVHKDLFGIWAAYANLSEWSQHKYWHEASEDAWYIRAKDCEEETTNMGTDGKSICTACRALGQSNNVLGHVDLGKRFQTISFL